MLKKGKKEFKPRVSIVRKPNVPLLDPSSTGPNSEPQLKNQRSDLHKVAGTSTFEDFETLKLSNNNSTAEEAAGPQEYGLRHPIPTSEINACFQYSPREPRSLGQDKNFPNVLNPKKKVAQISEQQVGDIDIAEVFSGPLAKPTCVPEPRGSTRAQEESLHDTGLASKAESANDIATSFTTELQPTDQRVPSPPGQSEQLPSSITDPGQEVQAAQSQSSALLIASEPQSTRFHGGSQGAPNASDLPSSNEPASRSETILPVDHNTVARDTSDQEPRVLPEESVATNQSNAIPATARPKRRPNTRSRRTQTQKGDNAVPSVEPHDRARKKKTPVKRKSRNQARVEEEHTSEVPKRKKRMPTPEGAEDEKIDQTKMKMADLCTDIKIGRKFSKHDELRRRLTKQRSQAAFASRHPGLAALVEGREVTAQPHCEPATEDEPPTIINQGVQMRMVNGQIVLDDSSLRVDRQQQALAENIVLEEVTEDDFTRITTSGTYMKRFRALRWDNVDDSTFYAGLRQFGTDFEMISKMFPQRSRRQVKLHFSSEEKKRPGKIKNALTGLKEEIDWGAYEAMTGLKYEEVEDIDAERRKEKEAQEQEEQERDEEIAEAVRQKKDAIKQRTEAAKRA